MKIVLLSVVFSHFLASPSIAITQNHAKQVLSEINLARTAPRYYAGLLRDFRNRFRGKLYTQPGSSVRVVTSEGVKPVDEAIRFLSGLKPLPPLSWSDGLSSAAEELATDHGRNGAIGHMGERNRGVRERVETYGKWNKRLAENIGYGDSDPRGMVMQLIIDDGVPDRGHLKNIFSDAFTTAGVACGPHPQYGGMCVIDFAGEFCD
jgi:uncharacterized protein YkwD